MSNFEIKDSKFYILKLQKMNRAELENTIHFLGIAKKISPSLQHWYDLSKLILRQKIEDRIDNHIMGIEHETT